MSGKTKKRKTGGFFGKYRYKTDGAIRGYDMSSRSVRVGSAVIFAVCIIFAVICLFPIIWVFLASFKNIREFTNDVTIFPRTFDFSRIAETWNALHFTKYHLNSLCLVAGAVVCAVIFNGLMAYAFAILKPKGYKVAYTLVMWGLMIPATVGIVAVTRNITLLGMSRQFLPLWLAYGANPFYVVLFRQFFEEIPKDIYEAAKIDGAGPLQIFFKIILPLSRPIIAVVAIFALTAAWSDFLLPYLVLNGSGKETVMVKLFSYKDTPTDAVSVLRAAMFSMIPPIILFAVFQRRIMDNASAGAVKG